MGKKSLKEELQSARRNGYAVGAFNIFNRLSARAVIQAASEMESPLILQTSVSTVKKYGVKDLGDMLRQLAEEAPINVLIHLDHCQSVELAKECINSGWDSVMYDGSRLPVKENIANCAEVVTYAHARGVQVEGELGRIAGVEDEIQVEEDAAVDTKLKEAVCFVQESGIDAFAPAIGTAHGIYKGPVQINYELVEELAKAIDTPIVIHGGTGLPENTFTKLILKGASKINISTALKHAYMDGSKEYFEKNPNKIDPLGLDQYLTDKIKAVARECLMTFRKNMK